MDPSQVAKSIMYYYSEHKTDDIMPISCDLKHNDNEIIIQILLAIYQEMIISWKSEWTNLSEDNFVEILIMGMASLGFNINVIDFDEIINPSSLTYYVRIDETSVFPEMKINPHHPLHIAYKTGSGAGILTDINELPNINILRNRNDGKIDIITFDSFIS